MTFDEWLTACARVAMGEEWEIDPDWPRWRELYDDGFSPEAATWVLFSEVTGGQ